MALFTLPQRYSLLRNGASWKFASLLIFSGQPICQLWLHQSLIHVGMVKRINGLKVESRPTFKCCCKSLQ